MPVFGYARVSSQDQDLSAQEAELVAAGAVKVYREKVSGAKANRAELMKVVNKLEPGDVLIVTRLDRLARSTRDLLNCWPPSASVVRASGRCAMRGPTRPTHTAD